MLLMHLGWKFSLNGNKTAPMNLLRSFIGIVCRDLLGAPGNIQLRAYAPSLGSSYAAGFSTISLAQLPTTGTLVPPLELEHLFDCIGPVHCVEEYVYRGTWTAPNKAADWMFGGQHCCLSGIFNMAAGEIFAEASLNNLDFPDTVYKTVSPIFHNRRPHTVGIQSDLIYNPAVYPTCQKNQVQISQAVNNLNGDDIRYSFFIPQDAGGCAKYLHQWVFFWKSYS